MPIYEVISLAVYEKKVLVSADSEAEAIEDAHEIEGPAHRYEWSYLYDEMVNEVTDPQDDYWSGGPDGRWVSPDEEASDE